MPTVTLTGHQLIVSPQMRMTVDFLDPLVMPDFENQAADFVAHSFVPGSVNTEEVDVTPIIHHLYELFAGSFVTGALNRRIGEHERARQLSSIINRLMFSSFINPNDGQYIVVMDISYSPRLLDAVSAKSFLNNKYLHELSLNSVN